MNMKSTIEKKSGISEGIISFDVITSGDVLEPRLC